MSEEELTVVMVISVVFVVSVFLGWMAYIDRNNDK